VADWKLDREDEVAVILLRAARELGEGLEPERVYERFQSLLSEVIQHDGLIVSSYDARDDLIRCEYVWNEGNVMDPSTLPPLPLNREGGGMQSRVIVSGESFVFNVREEIQDHEGVYYNVDREGAVRRIPDSGPPGTNAAMMVPVKHEGEVVGVVQLMTDRGDYTREQADLFEGLVAQMAAAVRTARLQRERRRLEAAEAAARAAAAEWEQAAQVLEAVGDAILLLDDEGVVRLWNRAAERMTGIRADAVRDRPLTEPIPDWPEIAARIPVAEGGANPRSVTLPAHIRGHDLWLSFVAVRSAAGVIYAFRDLTSERRLEEEKSDLVATISHELRTPMTAVYGAATTLLHRESDLAAHQRRQLLEMIAAEARRLAQITEEVLLTSQLDRGDLRIEHEPVDVVEVVTATLEAMAPQLDDSVNVDVEVPSALEPASGDRDRLQQVLVNLLDNAVKYAGVSNVTIRVDAVNGAIRIAVADRGPGIPFTDQERIFEKFYRADPQLAQAPGGTGLGLYISRELVRRMGGRLWVSSQLGDGATFTVELPLA
jgi:two-component system phosphate regulon sensor histidine kinase PhoR